MKLVTRVVLWESPEKSFRLLPKATSWSKVRTLSSGTAFVQVYNTYRVRTPQVLTYLHHPSQEELGKLIEERVSVLCHVEVAHNTYDDGSERICLDYRVKSRGRRSTHRLRVVPPGSVATNPLPKMLSVITLPLGLGDFVVMRK